MRSPQRPYRDHCLSIVNRHRAWPDKILMWPLDQITQTAIEIQLLQASRWRRDMWIGRKHRTRDYWRWHAPKKWIWCASNLYTFMCSLSCSRLILPSISVWFLFSILVMTVSCAFRGATLPFARCHYRKDQQLRAEAPQALPHMNVWKFLKLPTSCQVSLRLRLDRYVYQSCLCRCTLECNNILQVLCSHSRKSRVTKLMKERSLAWWASLSHWAQLCDTSSSSLSIQNG